MAWFCACQLAHAICPSELKDSPVDSGGKPPSSKILSDAYKHLSDRYRQTQDKRGIRSIDEAQAYVAARLPATRACLEKCLDNLPANYIPKTTLDVGAGPGTATLALFDRYPNIQATLLEDDRFMLRIGKELVPTGQWIEHSLEKIPSLVNSDLVVLSYVLNELSSDLVPSLIEKLWNATRQYLIILTPGTPECFDQLRTVRSHLINLGAYILAPCPHGMTCPIPVGDWCHFKARVQRTSVHRKTKGGELNYEDEKFSYLIATPHPITESYNRITKQPHHRSGHGKVEVCTPQGHLETISYSKSKSLNYKDLRSLAWGDRL